MSYPELALEPGEIHLWRASLDLPAGRAGAVAATLAPDEIERAERYRAPLDRTRYSAARGLLRDLLARYTAVHPRELRLEYGPQGKPAVACTPGSPALHFNVSHAGPIALYAFARGARVGLDVERVREVPHAERIASRIFPPDEMRSFLMLPEGERLEGFFSRWTRLEAVAKLHGGGVWWLVGRGGAIPDAGSISLTDLQAPAGYRAALAVDGEPRPVREMGSP